MPLPLTFPRRPLVRGRRALRAASTRSGFSLVEVLVAIAVLTIGIIAFLEIFPNGFLSLQVAANTSAADRLAQQELNQLTPGMGAEIQQVAAVSRIYQDSTDNGMPGMVQLDPNFNVDQALSPAADLTTQVSNGLNIASTSTESQAQNPEYYEYIGGERVSIPTPTADSYTAQTGQTTATPSSNVMLSFGPLTLPPSSNGDYAYPNPSSTTNTYNSLDPGAHYAFYVHGLPWASHPASSQPVTSAVAQDGTTTSLQQNVPVDDPESELKFDAPEYLIDYANGAIALRNPNATTTAATGNAPAPYYQEFIFQVAVLSAGNATPVTHTFLFTAGWPSADAPTGATNHLPFYDNTDYHSRWVSFTNYTDYNGNSGVAPPVDIAGDSLKTTDTFVPGTEKLVRDFNEVTAFDSDPYEFQLPAALGSNATGTYQIGELEFNPLAGKIVDTRGQPLQASVDYIVQDWHTIHEDKTVGSQSSGSNGAQANSVVRLTLTHLLDNGFVDTTGIKYTGIAGLGTGILVYDLDTFQPILQTPTNGAHYLPDYANGTITLYGYPVGTHVRVYYHAENYWGLTVLKPAASYSVETVAANGGSDTPSNTGEAILDVGKGYLYFPVCDIGRQVEIGGTAYYTSGGVTQSVPLNYLATLASAPGSTAAAPAQVSLIDAAQGAIPTAATITATTTPTAVGASLTARAIFRQNNQWRSRDVTTVDLPTAQ